MRGMIFLQMIICQTNDIGDFLRCQLDIYFSLKENMLDFYQKLIKFTNGKIVHYSAGLIKDVRQNNLGISIFIIIDNSNLYTYGN